MNKGAPIKVMLIALALFCTSCSPKNSGSPAAVEAEQSVAEETDAKTANDEETEAALKMTEPVSEEDSIEEEIVQSENVEKATEETVEDNSVEYKEYLVPAIVLDLGGMTKEDIELEGHIFATENDDGSVTVRMTEDDHSDWMKGMKMSLLDGAHSYVTDAGLTNLEVDDTLTHFTLETGSDSLSEDDSMALFYLLLMGESYNIMNGTPADDITVTCVNRELNETIAEISTKESGISAIDIMTEALHESDTEEQESTSTDEEERPFSLDEVTQWYRNNPMLIGEGIYFVGKDIQPASYGMTEVENNFGMEVIIFDNEEDYYAYHHSSRFTIGEENQAIEQYAAQHVFMYSGDKKALNLREGSVLRIKRGIAELSYVDTSIENRITETMLGKSLDLFEGNYEAGKDINSGGYMLTSTSDYGTRVTVFESEQKLKDFEADDHFTIGEFGTDVEKNAMIDIYINHGEQCYVNLQDGMILMLNNGTCFAEEVVMGWAE